MRAALALLAAPVAWLAACGEPSSSVPRARGGGAAGASGAVSGGAPSGGTPSSSGTANGAGPSSSGATSTASGASGSGGTATAGSGGASAGTSSSGRGGEGGQAGFMGNAGLAGAGAGTAGMVGAGAGGASGGTGGNPAACTRELLRSTIETYFDALAAHDPASLPLSDAVKFTENGELMDPGEGGLWSTAGSVKHTHSALDLTACTSVTQAVVPDGTTDLPFSLRLKLVDARITEIETIAVRQGDYSVPSNTGDLIASADTVGWEDPVPVADRSSRADISSWMEKYFRMFPRGVCNVTSDCIRIENGGGDYRCSAGASCAEGQPGPADDELDPRLILVDEETGLGVGYTMFMGHTDQHLFKMVGGEVHGVSAILAQAGASGW